MPAEPPSTPRPSTPSPSASSPLDAEPSGRVVVFWLFLALSVATALALLSFASIAPVGARPRIYTALVGNLALPVIAWYVYKNLGRHRMQP